MAKMETLINNILKYRGEKSLASGIDLQANGALAVSKAAELNRAIYKYKKPRDDSPEVTKSEIEELALDMLVIGMGTLGVLDHTDFEQLWSKLEKVIERNATRDFSDPL